jgi:hypothetical protein
MARTSGSQIYLEICLRKLQYLEVGNSDWSETNFIGKIMKRANPQNMCIRFLHELGGGTSQ